MLREETIDTYTQLVKKVKEAQGAPVSISADLAVTHNVMMLEEVIAYLRNNAGELLVDRPFAVRDGITRLTWHCFYSCALLGTNPIEVYNAMNRFSARGIVTGSLDDIALFIDNTIENDQSSSNTWLALLTKVTMTAQTLNAVDPDLIRKLQNHIKAIYP
ncbi:hypothetical protein NVP1215B_029 [Vibrio phage 1.215.B._10N.222.54.F7]|nr:hypothetical protein NVP1215A_029 [Vibrio phage 1.215.A._10N.222.54.F7]AUR96052.1 hypothetical protein NVP1215B_029 [Vibrio phage 1.215.B._10N.222.54.F7]